MSTLPRPAKSPAASTFISRPQSEFDAGINASTAWTESLEIGSIPSPSLSVDHLPSTNYIDDDADGNIDEEPTRPARALYAFEGKAEFRELTVEAGEEIEVVKEELADGWSLVKNLNGEIGLLPRTYFTFTADFATSPDLQTAPTRQREPSTSSITPRGSPRSSKLITKPIVQQNTGDWVFPSFRQSLLGGKSLNRFSTFVTSGAEEWILKGKAADTVLTDEHPPTTNGHGRDASTDTIADEYEIGGSKESSGKLAEADQHFVDATHSWKAKVPPFRVMVHSPSKRTSTLSGAYTIYNVTSLFHPQSLTENDDSSGGEDTPPGSPTRITVQRRYSHFVVLHTALTRRLPGIALPPLPEKQYTGRFSDDFVEARRGDLERYISRVVRHPVARYAEVVTFFLSCESDSEWKRLIPQHLALPAAGPSFYAHVFHPAFNLDLEDAMEAVDRFTTHTRAVGKGVQGLRNIFGRVRQARIEMSEAERLLSYSLLSLITSQPLASAPTTGVTEEDEQFNVKDKGLSNSQGAWCWREDCSACLKSTKSIQKAADSLQHIADLYDDHARRRQLATHEALKGVAHPSSTYMGVVTTHRSTLTRYREAIASGQPDDEVAGRCETVLNTTMAEMETYHKQKREDFVGLTKDYLDGEIDFYEQVLVRLRSARSTFDPPQYNQLAASPRQPSLYERELENPRLVSKPLLQPCPHVFDSAPMRPVSVAIQEGVGMLLAPSIRNSVFGKFW